MSEHISEWVEHASASTGRIWEYRYTVSVYQDVAMLAVDYKPDEASEEEHPDRIYRQTMSRRDLEQLRATIDEAIAEMEEA